MTMQPPIKDQGCIYIKESAHKHQKIIPEMFVMHVLSGCDTVTVTYRVGKMKAIAVAPKGYKKGQLG